MTLFGIEIREDLHLAGKVNAKYKTVFDGLTQAKRSAVALYFLAHKSQ